MKYTRLFISISLDASLSKEIYQKFENLPLPWEKLRLVDKNILHLTLKFLGNTPIEKLPDFINALSSIEKIDGFDLEIEGTSVINEKRPRILYLNIANNKKLNQLYNNIEQALFDAGLAHRGVQRFQPHITLARVKTSAEIKEFSSFSRWPIHKTIAVSNFELQESSLTRQGPAYTLLQSFDI